MPYFFLILIDLLLFKGTTQPLALRHLPPLAGQLLMVNLYTGKVFHLVINQESISLTLITISFAQCNVELMT